MAASFYEHPILNSPYAPPSRHHALDATGQPLDQEPVAGRRQSKLITPVPRAKKTAKKAQQKELTLPDAEGLSTAEQEYNPTPIINGIRSQVEAWRAIPNPKDWGVTPATARLLQHWREHDVRRRPPVLLPGRGGRNVHLADRGRPHQAPPQSHLGAPPQPPTPRPTPNCYASR